MLYLERPPDPRLAATVANLWMFSVPAGLEGAFPHIIPPDGCVSVVASINDVIPFRQMELSGAGFGMKHVEIPPGTTFIGARLQPGALGCFFEIPVAQVVNQFVDISHLPVWGGLLAQFRPGEEPFSPLEQALISTQIQAFPHPHVTAVADMLVRSQGAAAIRPISGALGVPERQLQRRFLQDTGVSMKEFARLYRMRTALIALLNREFSLTEVALDNGFADQSHFIREAIKLSQTNPGRLRAHYQQIRTEGLLW